MSARAAAEQSPAHDPGMTTGIVLVFMTVCVWGAQFPIAKSIFAHVDAFHTALFRYGLPAMVLVGVLVWREGKEALRFDARARQATLIGLIGMCGSPSLVFGGLMFARPEIAAIIIAVQPAMTAVVLWVLRGKRPATVSLICIAVAFLGVLTVVTRWSVSLAPTGMELVGDLMILAGAFCWVIYTVAGERFHDWSILRLTALTMLPGTVGHFVVVLVLISFGVFETPGFDDWYAVRWQLLYLSVIGVLISMLTWNAGTKRIGPLNAMLFLNLIPVVTFAIRYFQGYRFAPMEIFGATLVIGALIVNNLWLRGAFDPRITRRASPPLRRRPGGRPLRAAGFTPRPLPPGSALARAARRGSS